MQNAWQDPPAGYGGHQIMMPSFTGMVRILVLANVAIFLLQFVVDLASDSAGTSGFISVFGLHPGKWIDWFPFLPVWQLVTYGFLHSVQGPGHIFFNMLMLYFLGTMLEGVIGPRRLLSHYVAGILVAGVGQLLFAFAFRERVPTVGASGAVLAVVVAMATLQPMQRIIFILFPITLRTLALVFVGFDLFWSLKIVFQDQVTGSAHFAHLFGAAWGFVAVRKGWIWRDPIAAWERRREDSQGRQAVADEERLDRLLGQISEQGIHSLSQRDRAFLKRMSKRR